MVDDLEQTLQDAFVSLVIMETEFISLVLGQVKPSIFTSPVSRAVVSICYNYYTEHKEAPKQHIADELSLYLEDKDERESSLYYKYVEKVLEIPPNQSYVLKRIGDFIKQRSYEEASVEFAELVKDHRFDEAQNLMYETLKTGIEKEDAGLDYLTDFSSLANRGEGKVYDMSTGIKALDILIGGFQRGQFIVLCGGYKSGKTWGLMHFARTAMRAGLSVLYVSHEVSKEELELRFDMMFSARGTDRIGQTAYYKSYNHKKHDLDFVGVEIRSVYNNSAVTKARKNISRFGGKLRIKKYPMGTCSVEELERLLHYLETFEKFIPDVMINDYADIMQLPGRDELRHQIHKTYIAHKGIADERNIIVFTASQIASNFLTKKTITQQAPAEDRRKVGTADIMLGITRTEEEAKDNVGHINVIAIRSGGNQFSSCNFSSCLEIGQWAKESWLDFENPSEKEILESLGEKVEV